jgi:hypothetical protein
LGAPGKLGNHDVIAEAEEALNKLRQNPGDKEAAEALEKATQRLKARTKKQETTNSRR